MTTCLVLSAAPLVHSHRLILAHLPSHSYLPHAPLTIKSRSLGSAFLLTAVSGMLLGQVVGLPSVWGTPIMWPYILLFVSVPAFFQLTLLQPFLLESPRWLLMIGASPARDALDCLLMSCTLTVVILQA